MAGILQYLFDGAEIIGTIAFAASGAMLAIDRQLDLFGVLFLGAVTAVGGGIMRDVILGIVPPHAFSDPIFVEIALATALAVFLFAYLKGRRYWKERNEIDRIVNLLDAVGLGVFSVLGAQKGMMCGFEDNAFLCIFMGMTTGVGGGVLRDLLSRTVPAVMHKRIYAVASIAGAAAYYFLADADLGRPIAMLMGMILTVVIRVLATRFTWDLPVVHRDE